MIWLDYLLFLMPGLLLSMWAQARIARAYAAGSRIPAGSGLSGAEAAQFVMRAGGVTGIGIEPVVGELSDHYDPRGKVLRLSSGVYSGRSLAALGVARARGGTRHPGCLRISRAGRPESHRAPGGAGLAGLLAVDRRRVAAGDVPADHRGDRAVLAGRAVPAPEPSGRVRRQPTRSGDSCVRPGSSASRRSRSSRACSTPPRGPTSPRR